ALTNRPQLNLLNQNIVLDTFRCAQLPLAQWTSVQSAGKAKVVTHWFITPPSRRNAMRPILATTVTALAVSVVMSTVVFAQKAKTDAARASRAEATGSLNDSYNRCVT